MVRKNILAALFCATGLAGVGLNAGVIENFDSASEGTIATDGSTTINGTVYIGSTADTTNSTGAPTNPYPTQVKNSGGNGYISLWCEDDTRGNITWGADGAPSKTVSNVVIDFGTDADKNVAAFAADLSRTQNATWWYRIQSSADNGTTWQSIKAVTSGTNNATIAVNETGLGLTGIDKIRINIWRNGATDPREMKIDNIRVYNSAVSGLQSKNRTASGVDLEWTAVAGATGYSVAVSENSNLSSPVFTSSPTGTSVSVTGLDAGKTYYCGVTPVVSGGAITGPSMITVSPYVAYKDLAAGETESFDNGIPTAWAVINNGGNAWLSGPPANSSYRPTNTDGSYVSCGFDKPNNDWLITHKVAIPSDGRKLTFKAYHAYRTGNAGKRASQRSFKVKVAVDTGSNQTTTADYQDIFSFDQPHPDQNFQTFEANITDAAYKGKDVYIAFVYDGNDGRALSLDDVKLEAPITEITGYETLEAVTVRAGDSAVDSLSKIQALLQTTYPTVTIAGQSDTRAVTWNSDSAPSYDHTSAGTYVFTATLGAVPSGYVDTTPETVTVNVVVTDNFGIKTLTNSALITSPATHFNGTDMTVMTWLNLDSSSPRGGLFQLTKSGAATGGYLVVTGADGKLEYWDGTNYRNMTTNGGAIVPRNQWVHVALTLSTTNKSKVYVNGVEYDTTRTIVSEIIDAQLSVGGPVGNDVEWLVGSSFDEVAVFSSALTAQQITGIYNSGSGAELASAYPNMELYWRFEDTPQGTSVADSDDDADSAGTISGTNGTDFKWVSGKSVGSTVTPAIGLTVSLADNVLSWSVLEERGVKEYRVVDADTGKVYEVVLAVDADSYSVEVPEGVNIELIVVDQSGHSKSYIPADGNIVKELYNLQKGWNLIGITSDNADLDTLKDETAGVIWGWNGVSYEVVDEVPAASAVWVYTTGEKTVAVSGKKSDAAVVLYKGWNMVGPVVTMDVPEAADTVYAWSTVYDIIVDKYNALEQGKGYWIFSR